MCKMRKSILFPKVSLKELEPCRRDDWMNTVQFEIIPLCVGNTLPWKIDVKCKEYKHTPLRQSCANYWILSLLNKQEEFTLDLKNDMIYFSQTNSNTEINLLQIYFVLKNPFNLQLFSIWIFTRNGKQRKFGKFSSTWQRIFL